MANVGLNEKASNVNILNNIRAGADDLYQSRIPEATKDNIREIGNAIQGSSYQAQMNVLMNELVNRISFVYINAKAKFENPLRDLKKGMIPYGVDVEEIYVGYAKDQGFDPERAETQVFKRTYPDVKALYHRMNRQGQYKVTISREQLAQAFISDTGLSGLISQMVESLYKGDELDEFLLMKHLFSDFYTANKFYPVVIGDSVPTTTDQAKDVVVKMRAMANRLIFPSELYNAAGVLQHTRKEDLHLFLMPEFEAFLDVQVLAYAFNMSKAELMGKITIIDDFGSAEGMENVIGVMADRDWFQVWDKLYETGSIYNPEGLYWNNTLNHWQTLSTSDFNNAVVFLAKPTPTAVAINPTTANVQKGQSIKFTATVTGDGSNNVEYAVTGTSAVSANTRITADGILTVGSDETNTALTITATSFYDNMKQATATVTVIS